MSTLPARRPSGILVALALCMALQMTGFVMLLPLFARRFESFGAGVEALGVSAMAYALTSTLAAPFIGVLAERFDRHGPWRAARSTLAYSRDTLTGDPSRSGTTAVGAWMAGAACPAAAPETR